MALSCSDDLVPDMTRPAGLRVEVSARPEDLLQLALSYPDRYPVFLDSAGAGPLANRHLLFRSNGEILRRDAAGRVSGNHAGEQVGFLDALQAWYQQQGQRGLSQDWLGGWVVYLGYECAAEVEPTLRLPPSVDPLSAYAAYCSVQLAADVGAKSVVISGEAGSQALLDACIADLDAVARTSQDPAVPAAGYAVQEDPAEQFLSAVHRAQQHIAAGDIYQANLSRGWRAALPVPRAAAIRELYPRLRHANPGPFAALLQTESFAVLSSSPERLIQVSGRSVATRPIAGTRPRSRRADADAAEIAALIAHPKERAEHIMLIDLERNDLGRVCEGGSVEVDEFLTVESYQHVHHIVSSVRGRLRAGLTMIDALRAVFPGGTITGVPKIRCMQLIAQLEGQGRGAYTGSLGYLGLNGQCDFNILIRTLVIDALELRFRTGAGIVADSDAERELEETRAKARGLLAALAGPT